jgi:hypothetical protein
MSRARSIVLRTPDGKRVTPPLFSHTYLLTVREFENPKGKWYGWHCQFEATDAAGSRLSPDDELFLAAKDFRELVSSGVAKAAMESVNQDSEDPDEM